LPARPGTPARRARRANRPTLISSGLEIDVDRVHPENVLIDSEMVKCEGEEDVSVITDMESLLEKEEGNLWFSFGMIFPQ
jgi:hypothetical protein